MIIQKNIIDDITNWIDLHLCERLTMDKIADRAGYSKWHLQRMFRNFNKITISVYIRNKRLKTACSELIKTDDRIIDICERNGFVSQQSFTRIFVRQYGMPPATFRQVGHASQACTCDNL